MIEFLESVKLFGNPLIDFRDFGELLLRFVLNVGVVYVVVRIVFYPIYREKNYLFTYFLINLCVFFVCTLLSTIKLKIGFAFGMFAVFAIIRYRTEPIPIRQMTYLFVVIIVAVINALSTKKVSYAELLFSNLAIVFFIYILEKRWLYARDTVKEVRYDRIELIRPERYDEFIKDLRERTGLNIRKAEVDSVNFMNDTAWIKIYYSEENKVEKN